MTNILEKPVKPTPPNVRNYPMSEKPSDETSPYIIAYRKYQKAVAKYEIDIAIYEQTKLIRFVKNANEKLILKKYKIFKNKDVPKPSKGNNKVIFHFKD